MRRYKCKPKGHKIPTDFYRLVGTKRFWRCSNCQGEGVWARGWQYFGTIECFGCGYPAMESVLCADCNPKAPTRRKARPEEMAGSGPRHA